MFDRCNFEKENPLGIPVEKKNKKVVGMLKDEAGGKISEEFVGLRAKHYSYKMHRKGKKKLKGLKRLW